MTNLEMPDFQTGQTWYSPNLIFLSEEILYRAGEIDTSVGVGGGGGGSCIL